MHSQLKSITVSPDPPVPGKNLTVNVKADVLETIEVCAMISIEHNAQTLKLQGADWRDVGRRLCRRHGQAWSDQATAEGI